MPGNTDRRIIQMQFENRQFEKNIAKSTKSVEDLKRAMDFEETSKGLKKFADGTKNLTLSGFEKLSDNIQKLTDKFTGLGTLSELVVSQIRRGIESAARDISNFINSMTTVQVSAGMEKYNTLNKSVQTIKAATGESEDTVYTVLKRLSNYTDQTSYNFADMAQNIGKFTSVGIDLESAERQMEGIANWAARSGAGINEASRAMYNLSQAMGVGKLTKIDWKSIENAGMATKEFKEQLIQAGVAAGTLVEKQGKTFTKNGNTEVNYKNVADTLAKGWATSQVLSSTLEKYYYDDLYYENENQEAILKLSETQQQEFDKMIESTGKVSGVMWKSLSSTGAITEDTKQKIVDLAVSQGKLTKETKEDGKIIYKTVNKTGKQIEFAIDEIESSLSVGWFDKGVADAVTSVNTLAKESYEAAQKCLTFTDVLGAWRDQISSGWMRSFTIIFGELSEAMKFFSDVCNRVGDGLGEIIDFRNSILEGWSNTGGRQSLIDLIIGNYGDNVSEGAYGFLDLLEGAGSVVKEGLKNFLMLFMGNEQRNSMGEDPEYLQKWISGLLLHITNSIRDFMKSIRDFFTEGIEVNGKTTTRLEIIQNVVNGIAGAIKIGYDILTKAIEFISEIGSDLSPGFNALLGFFGDLGTSIFNTADEMGKTNGIKEFFSGLREDVKPLTDALNSLMTTVSELFRSIFGLDKEGQNYAGTFSSIGSVIRDVARIVSSVGGPIIKFISDIISIISDLISGNLSLDNLPAIGQRVKESFKTMISGMPKPIQKVVSYIGDLRTGFQKLFKEGFTAENIKNIGELLKKPFTKAFDLIPDNIKNKFNEIVEKIKTLFKDFWNKVAGLWDKISGKGQKSDGKNIFQKIIELFGGGKNGKSIFETIKEWINGKFESLISFIQQAVGNVGGTANSFGQKVSELIEKLKKINLSKVLLWLMGGLGIAAIVLTIVKIYKMFKMLAKGISIIGDAIKNGISLKLKDSDKKIESFGDKMLKIAGAIAILTACIVVIGNMDANEALRGIMYVITLMAALVIMSYALKKVYGDMDWKSGISIFLGLVGTAIAIGLLSDALVKIGKMNFWQFLQSILGLAAIIVALSVVGELSKDGQFQFSNLSGMIALSLSIAILIASLNLIKNAKPEQLIKMGVSLIALLGILYIFMKKVSENSVSMSGSGMTQMIALAGAISILILSLNIIKNSKPEQLLTMAGVLIGILGILWAFMKITSGMSMEGAGLTQLIALAGSIAILMIAMIPLALLPLGRLAQAVGAVVIIMASLYGFMALTRTMTMSGTALAQFIALAGSIVILVLAMIPLAFFPLGKLAQAVGAVVVIIMALAGFMILINRFDGGSLSGKGMLGFVAVAASIAVLVYALMPLAALSPEQLLQFIGGLLSIMLGISLVIKTLKELELKSAIGGLLVLLSMTVLILAFAAALHDLKDTNFAVIIAFSAGLALMCVGFATAIQILSKIDLISALKGILLLTVLIAALGLLFALIGPLVVGSIASSLNQLSGSLNFISEMLIRFSEAMSSLDESSADKGQNFIGRLKDIFNQIRGLGSYTGDISRLSTSLYDLATGLELFQDHSRKLTDPDKDYGLKFIQALANEVPNLHLLSKTDVNGLITKISGLGGAMILYGKGAKEMKAEVGEIGENDIPDVTAAVKIMQAISTSLVDEGGFIIPENMPSSDEFGLFGAQLAALAGALIEFETAGQGLGAGYENGKKALEYFKQLKTDLKDIKYDDIREAIYIFGQEQGTEIQPDDLVAFGTRIAQLGKSLSDFAIATQYKDEATGEMKPVDYSTAIESLESFKKLEEDLKRIGNGGYLSTLGGQIQTLGSNLRDFAIKIIGDGTSENPGVDFGDNKIENATDFIDRMISVMERLKTSLPKVGGLSNFFTTAWGGRNADFTELSGQMQQLATGLGALGTNLNNDSWANTTGVRNAFDTMDGFFALMIRIQSFYKQVQEMGVDGWTADSAFQGLSEFVEHFANDDSNVISNLSEFMRQIDYAMSDWANYDDNNLDKTLTRMEAFKDFAEGFAYLTSTIDSDRKAGTSWGFLGTKLTTEVAASITDGIQSVSDSVIGMVRAMFKAADPVEGVVWSDIGVNMVKGVALGIDNESPVTLWPSVRTMMQTAYEEGKKAIDSNSPSKLFMQLGSFMGEGTAIGIKKSTGEVGENAAEMGEVALDSAQDMIGLISRIIAEGADATPTIAPILDMTNIDSGMAAFRESLNGYGISLDTSYSAGNAARIGTSAYEDTEALKPDYTGIYRKMEELGTQMQQMGREIRNMKLVLDTGAVAGGVADILDEEFGRRTFYELRE